MDDVKRYSPVFNWGEWDMRVRDDGYYVRAEDYDALRQQLAEARELLREAYGHTTTATDLLPERIKAALAQAPDHGR